MSHARANRAVAPFVGTASSYFYLSGHDFSRPGVHAGPLAPQMVHNVLRSPGQPLDPEARAFFEPRYGHDFSRVRVHADRQAGESARAVGAEAYTVGWEIAFAAGRYRPRTPEGQRLLAHELAHVAQQRDAADPGPDLAIGHPSDAAERNADAALERALHGPGQAPPGAIETTATLRRTTIPSWAGEFDADDPKPIENVRMEKDGVERGTYGAKTEIRFTPKGVAEADEVALVQTASSFWDGQPYYLGSDAERRATEARSTKAGTHIDQPDPSARTPLAGMRDPPATSNDLAASRPGPDVQFGNPPSKNGENEIFEGTTVKQAVLFDEPTIKSVPDEVAAAQNLETAALAVSGQRKGVYYGAVTWGWHKDAGGRKVTPDPVKAATSPQAGPPYNDAPSREFGAASDLWNKTITDKNNRLPLPIATGKFVAHTGTKLMERPAGGKQIASLDLHTRVEITGRTEQKQTKWVNVIVTDGSHVGRQGWVEEIFLNDFKVKKSQ